MEEAPRYALFTLLILLTLFNTIYAIRTSLHCLNIDLHAYLYCWGRFERWSGLTRNEQNVGWSGWMGEWKDIGYPLLLCLLEQ